MSPSMTPPPPADRTANATASDPAQPPLADMPTLTATDASAEFSWTRMLDDAGPGVASGQTSQAVAWHSRPSAAPDARPPPSRATTPRRPTPKLHAFDRLAGASAWLNAELGRCRRLARPAALLWVQLEPSLAATNGALVRTLGQRMRHRVRASDQMAQVGDDAFMVLLVDVTEAAARLVVKRLHATLHEPSDDAARAPLPAHLCFALMGRDGDHATALLQALGVTSAPPGAA